MKAARTVGVLLLPVLCLLVLTGCVLGGGSDPDKGSSYDPVPDAQLFADVGRIDGVRSVDLDYLDSFANPNSYAGTITVEPGAKDVAGIVDRMCAILRQGHPDASILVSVALRGNATVATTAYHVALPQDLEKRYGPQPGTGEPPQDARPLGKVPGVP